MGGRDQNGNGNWNGNGNVLLEFFQIFFVLLCRQGGTLRHTTHHTTRTYRHHHHTQTLYIHCRRGWVHTTWRTGTGETRLIGRDTYLTGSTLGKTVQYKQRGGIEEMLQKMLYHDDVYCDTRLFCFARPVRLEGLCGARSCSTARGLAFRG